MSSKKTPTLDDQLSSALDNLLSQGWDEPMAPAAPRETIDDAAAKRAAGVKPSDPRNLAVKRADPAPTYPPLPVRTVTTYEHPPVHPQGPPIDVMAPDTEDDEEPPGGVLNIGLLTDLASGRKTAQQAADAAGLTVGDIQTQLATALHEMDPKEIAKAMGVQAAEQQLKSGALYGAVLSELVRDMIAGRMKPETKIELAKMLAKNGAIEPKDQKGVVAGNGFVLNINLGSVKQEPVIINPD